MKFYLSTYDSYDWGTNLHHKETVEMLNGKEILLLQVYDDVPAQQQVIELTVEELKMLNDHLCYGYGMDESEYPLIELDDVNEKRMIFNFQMQSIY